MPVSALPPDPPRGRLRTWGRVTGIIWHKVFEDRILGMAAEAGFWGLVSLPSLALALFGALGYLRGVIGAGDMAHIHDDVLRVARDVLTSATVTSDVTPLVDAVLDRGQASVVSIGFVISLWSGSTAMSCYLNTITVAYGMRGLRGAVRSRIVALGLYLVALVFGVVLLPALALGPELLTHLAPSSLGSHTRTVVRAVYVPVVGAGSVAILALVYTACLPVRVRWRRALPGATVAMALWLLFSFVVRAYLSSGFRSGSAYGSLSAPIAGLLFFYFTALAVLLGAELNAALDAVRPDAATDDARRRVLAGVPRRRDRRAAASSDTPDAFDAFGATEVPAAVPGDGAAGSRSRLG
ncbi:MAG TPA: YihY/virulence factor BrkB family protein [Acidimicrobiales bacterium]|nr:YihY/virulence factor BrkB family protein [Acidimicrobiales bacterium]